MNSFSLPGYLVRWLDRWMAHGPDVHVLDVIWNWQPRYSAGVLVTAALVLWAITILVYRSGRVRMSWPWRVGLGFLRVVALSVPVFMLLQPELHIRLERIRPRTLAFMVDQSASMSVRDGRGQVRLPQSGPSGAFGTIEPDPVSQSRWESAVNAVLQATKPMRGARGKGQGARDEDFTAHPSPLAPHPVQTRLWLFDENARDADWAELKPEVPPRSERLTAIGTALRSVRASLRGEPDPVIVLLSDGADNASADENAPLAVARELGRDAIPVHTVLVGSEHARDVAVGVTTEAPFAFTGDPVPLQIRVEHTGFDAMPVTLTVRGGQDELPPRRSPLHEPPDGGGPTGASGTIHPDPLAARQLTLPADGQPASERIEVTFDSPGRRQCEVSVTPLSGELTAANNTAWTEVLVLDKKIRVLYVEHWPRWQYRFLRNAFQRDARFDTRLVLLTDDPSAPQEERQGATMPATAEEFSKFDTFIIGEVARQDLSPQQWQWLHDCVVDGGAGVIFIAGPDHNPADFTQPPIDSLLPFERVTTVAEEEVAPFKPVLTPLGLHHPLMRLGTSDDPADVWQRLPNLQWYAGVTELKPGAMVLADRPAPVGGDATPLIILQRAGRGSSLFVGTDETWKWRYQVGNAYFYGFWRRAIQHVGMPHRVGEFQTVKVEAATRITSRNVPVSVSVAIEGVRFDCREAALRVPSAQSNLTPSGFGGNEDTIKLIAERQEGGQPLLAFTLRRSADSPLAFLGEVRFPSEGTYRLYVEGRDKQGETTVDVRSSRQFNPELAMPAVDFTLLRRMAELSGGKSATIDELPALLAGLDLAPLRFRWTERISLWDNWTLLIILAGLLTAEWVLRKVKYLP